MALLAQTRVELSNGDEVAPAGRIRVAGTSRARNPVIARETWAVFRMVAIAEGYVDNVSRTLFTDVTVGQTGLFKRLVAEAESHAYDSWRERKDVFSRYHRIPLSECAKWSDIDAAIEIRNSVAHGLGRLTERQRTSSTISTLSRIGVHVVDDRLIVTTPVAGRCYQSAREFISSLDQQAAKRIFRIQ